MSEQSISPWSGKPRPQRKQDLHLEDKAPEAEGSTSPKIPALDPQTFQGDITSHTAPPESLNVMVIPKSGQQSEKSSFSSEAASSIKSAGTEMSQNARRPSSVSAAEERSQATEGGSSEGGSAPGIPTMDALV